MKIQTILRRPIACAAALVLASASARAETYSWLQTSGGTYNWTDTFNWDPSTAYPSAAGDVANITTDITATHTIRLRAPISLGTLNVGDGVGSGNNFSFILANLTGETFALTFDSSDPGVSAQINLQSSGTPTTTISAPVVLNTPLEINVGGVDTANAQRIAFTGTIATQDQPITITGGFFNSGAQTTMSGTIFGGEDAVITNNSLSPLLINGVQSAFFGKIVVNNRATGSNQAGLTVHHTGSLADAGEFEINGYLSGGNTQNGGTVHVGQGSSVGANPGQRLTRNVITFNGGTLHAGGQPLNVDVVDRKVRDEVNVVNLNSGYSLLTLTSNTHATNGDTRRELDVATLNRAQGASLFVRGSKLDDAAATNATTFLIDNASAYLKGSGSTSGTNMSIIPWMTVSNTNVFASASDTFATYTSGGVRGLNTSTEYANSIDAGADANVSVGGASIAGIGNTVTVNSLRIIANGASDLGFGNTLVIASGGLILSNSTSGIGNTGSPDAGTIEFGSEGVVWSNGSNNNTVGASISGTAGLSKAGTGTLILTGADNTFSGLTYVGSGVLQVGNGGIFSTLGASNEIEVAAGAQLSLTGGNMIADTATLRLEQYGLFNGKTTLFPEVNDTIGALWLGDQMMAAGTYGALGSGATFEDDQWFSGTGVLTVVPEPASAVFLVAGLGVTLARRRRH